MKFLTGMQEVKQYSKNMYFTMLNQIFEDSEGVLHFTPRYLRTDGYTILNIFSPLGGGRFEEDIRCSSAHDLWCRYRTDIQITISEAEMAQKAILISRIEKYPSGEEKLVYEAGNIPKCYLKFVPINFTTCNRLFSEMLKCVEMSERKRKLLSAGVYLNIGWVLDKGKYTQEMLEKNLYNDFL